MQENGFLNESDTSCRADYERNMHKWFQLAVDKGGKIEGYTRKG
jgi:hypothetical protein